jgi:hypothetical protein
VHCTALLIGRAILLEIVCGSVPKRFQRSNISDVESAEFQQSAVLIKDSDAKLRSGSEGAELCLCQRIICNNVIEK